MDDDDDRQTTLLPPCFYCKHLIDIGTQITFQGWKCPAFPDGIPPQILTRDLSHEEYIPGQQGEIVYESKDIDGNTITFAGVWSDESVSADVLDEEV